MVLNLDRIQNSGDINISCFLDTTVYTDVSLATGYLLTHNLCDSKIQGLKGWKDSKLKGLLYT